MAFVEQMGNIGTEINRAIQWKEKDRNKSIAAFERGLELLDLTIEDPKNRRGLKELCRLREVAADYFCSDNEYDSTSDSWESYFYPFSYAIALRRGL